MLNQIILLSDESLSPAVAPLLQAVDPRVRVVVVTIQTELEEYATGDLSKSRLISFGSEVIVPAHVLSAFPYPSYNIHPGPPSLPGRFPSVFAIYNDFETFATTVHEMTPKVDSGAIVAVDEFPVPEGVDRAFLDMLSFQSALGLIGKLSPKFVMEGALEALEERWSGKATTQKDFEALCRLPEGISAQEFQKRYRAVGEGPDHALEISLYGQRFVLDNQRDEAVSVGGQIKP